MPEFSILSEISVEYGANNAQSETRLIRHTHAASFQFAKPFFLKAASCVISSENPPFRRVLLPDVLEVGLHVAHQTLNNSAAQLIFPTEGNAFGDRKRARIHRAGIGPGLHDVLRKAFRQGRDRACSEPDDGAGRVVGIALEVPVKAAFAQGDRHGSSGLAK